jgi:hypothetical protein
MLTKEKGENAIINDHEVRRKNAVLHGTLIFDMMLYSKIYFHCYSKNSDDAGKRKKNIINFFINTPMKYKDIYFYYYLL